MAAKKLNKTQREVVKLIAFRGSLCNIPITQIIEDIKIELGVTLAKSTIHHYIEQCREELRTKRYSEIDLDGERNLELAKLEAYEAETKSEWHRSKEPVEVTITE